MLNTQTIGNKITEARKKMNLSQGQLAERLFISSQAVGKWERGESMPDITTFNRMAELLGVDLNYFSETFQSVSNVKNGERIAPEVIIDETVESPKKKLSWNMSSGNWSGADFSGLKNLHEKFSSSNMLNCKFAGSDLSGLLLKDNNVNTCDFTGSGIRKSQMQRSFLSDNIFKNCSLEETEFSGSFVSGSDFTGADLTGVIFRSGGFEKNTLKDVVWNRTTFSDSSLSDLVFTGKVEDCSFENCAFTRVTFENSTLINTFFKNKTLKRLKFVDCKADRMSYEFLKNGKADLTGLTLMSQ